ncbi:MAG: KamA family radical SAM protein [FCB group bacterium]|nr:KamA family radical SAM protein [FCB group bacterium]
MDKVKYISNIDKVSQLSETEKEVLKQVTVKYAFRANEYYLSLIDWNDPDDPIRKIIIPSTDELQIWGDLDVSDEIINYKAPGLQHKYRDTVLLILNKTCGSFCRFCFRKRLFMPDNIEVINNIDPGIEYIRNHPEVTNVLLTGGEPLFLSTVKLQRIIGRIAAIDHVKIIRLGTKIPVFNPYRILNDPELPKMLRSFNRRGICVYIMCHINHPRELTAPAVKALALLSETGSALCNQTPILRGINDDATVLRTLMQELSYLGVAPYYFFINRPVEGNKPFCIPVSVAYQLFVRATTGLSGVARRAKLVMSHATGKIQVAGLNREHIFLRYNRARNAEDEYKMMIFKRDDKAYWFDDYETALIT